MNSKTIRVGLHLFPEEGYRTAALPLFERGLVDAIEWDIDERWGYGWGDRRLPRWVNRILDAFASHDALYGHGVWLSVLSALPEARQERWLTLLARECRRRPYRHVTEHLGFLTAGAFAQGTMFPAPFTDETVAVGRAQMARLQEAARCPVGLENGSMALGMPDLMDQGALLEAILAPTGSVLLLDLHNVHVQATNFDFPADLLLERLPLRRARELHVSGGAWFTSRRDPGARPVRLDSHDGAVPEEVFALVPRALALCPDIEVAFLERRASTLTSAAEIAQYQADFLRLRDLVEAHARAPAMARPAASDAPLAQVLDAPHAAPRSVETLGTFQAALLELLARCLPAEDLARELATSPAFEAYRDYTASFDARMLEVTMALFDRWGSRTDPDRDAYLRRRTRPRAGSTATRA
jgi:uncharacterized protein (UPF0276 family)